MRPYKKVIKRAIYSEKRYICEYETVFIYNYGAFSVFGLLAGAGQNSFGGLIFFKSNSSSYTALYAVGYVVGAACLGAGIPLWVKGNKKLGEIADDYNRNYGTPRRSPGSGTSLNLGPTHSGGLGLSLNF